LDRWRSGATQGSSHGQNERGYNANHRVILILAFGKGCVVFYLRNFGLEKLISVTQLYILAVPTSFTLQTSHTMRK